MDGLKNIEIKNFRGIENLKIEDFSRVNVFLGQNSSGKSSVLECIFLLMGMSNPGLPQNVNALRARHFTTFSDLNYLFRNDDLKLHPEISSEMMNETNRHLSLELTYVFEKNLQQDLQAERIPSSEAKTYQNTLKMNFSINNNLESNNYECSITVNQAGGIIDRKISDGYVEKYNANIISADLSVCNPANDIIELTKMKRKEVVLEMMQKFDSHITTVEILKDVAYIGFDASEQLMAVDMMGDGMRRFLNIVAASANPKNSIVIIDEIDNGLHYSAYKKLWEAIFAMAVSTDKQVFVTTHSRETLCRLNEMLEEHPEYQQEMRLYTIENTKLQGHQAYKMTYNGLHEACTNDIELRSIVL